MRPRWTCQDVLSFLDTLWKNAILRSFGWKVQFLALVGLSSLFFNSCQPGASLRHWRLLCSFSNVPSSSEDQGHIYPTFINMVMFSEFFNLQLGKTLLYIASSFFKTYLNKGISLINYSCRRAQSTLIPRSGGPGHIKRQSKWAIGFKVESNASPWTLLKFLSEDPTLTFLSSWL